MAGAPKLDAAWWKKNKAVTLGKTGMGDALREYEVALEKEDFDKVLKALANVKKAAAVGLKEANKLLHKDTIKMLTAYDGVVATEIKRINDLAKSQKTTKKDDKPAPPPKQKVTGPVKLWEIDVSEQVLKKIGKVGNTWIKNFKGYKIGLTINEDLLDLLENEGDYVTPAFMVEDAQKVGAMTVDAVVAYIVKIDELVGVKPEVGVKAMEKLASLVKDTMNDAGKKLEKIPEKRWKAFVAKHDQYRSYQVKAGVNLTIGVLGVVGSAVSVAGAAGTYGATLPLSIIALVRSVASVTKQLVDMCKDAEAVGEGLRKDCDQLMDWYKSKGKRLLNETANTVINGLIGVDPGIVPTIGSAEKNFTLWDNKVAGCVVTCRNASKGILKLLKECDDLEKSVKKNTGKDAQKAMAKLKKARAALDKCLDTITTLMAKVSKFESNGPGLLKVIQSLRKDNSKFSDIFEKVFPLTVNLALAAGNAADGFSAAASALDNVNTALSLFNDLAVEGLGQAEVL